MRMRHHDKKRLIVDPSSGQHASHRHTVSGHHETGTTQTLCPPHDVRSHWQEVLDTCAFRRQRLATRVFHSWSRNFSPGTSSTCGVSRRTDQFSPAFADRGTFRVVVKIPAHAVYGRRILRAAHGNERSLSRAQCWRLLRSPEAEQIPIPAGDASKAEISDDHGRVVSAWIKDKRA